MKKILVFLFVLLLGRACAEDNIAPGAIAAFEQAYPGYTIAAADQWGTTAAAILTSKNQQALCIVEEKDGVWQLKVCNRKALRENTPLPSLFLDTDISLFWTYHDSQQRITYSASKTDGVWVMDGLICAENLPDQTVSEAHLFFSDGLLRYQTYLCDANDNILSMQPYQPVPASWLDGQMDLNLFDDTMLPLPNQFYTHSWLDAYHTEQAAKELFPDYSFLDGCVLKTHLEFLLQDSSGKLYFAACRYDEGWKTCLSTPLPPETQYGCENFTRSLVIDGLLVNIGPVDGNTFGIVQLYTSTSAEELVHLGKNWIGKEMPVAWNSRFGSHPWDDLALIDWTSLPHSFEEACSQLDTTTWAVVNNPHPHDRLHLRTSPDRSSKSLGKYYNGTPVQILRQQGDWVRVSIFGVEGWMMCKYLAFGDSMHSVEAVFPAKFADNDMHSYYIYSSPETLHIAAVAGHGQPGVVLGGIGDEWYHIALPDFSAAGYVRQYEWWDGNG